VTGLDSPGRKKERALTCGAVLSATKEEKREGARWAGTGKELGFGLEGFPFFFLFCFILFFLKKTFFKKDFEDN
jgi:hypothetical protein